MQIYVDGQDITGLTTQCSISRSTNAMCWEVRISTADIQHKPYYHYGQQRITIIDDDNVEYGFLLEEWGQSYDDRSEWYEFWGRSLQARAGQGYAQSITDTEATEGVHPWQNAATTAQAVIDYLLESDYCPYPLEVSLNIGIDYPIKKGALSVSNQYPLDIILTLASEIGAYVFPEPDGSLTIEKYELVGTAGGVSYTEYDDIFEIPGSIKVGDYYNSVTILGYDESAAEESETSVKSSLSVKSLGSGTNCEGTPHTVRVYKYHPTNATLQIFSTPDAAVVSAGSGSENFTERLILKNGLGSHSLFDSDGKNDVDIPSLHGTKAAFYEVSYSTPYVDYNVDGDAGDHIVLFYFDDGSAEAEYSFSTEDCPPPPTCGSAHPELCTSETACNAVNLYWWNNACHTDSQPTKDATFLVVNSFTGVVLPGATPIVDGVSVGTTDAEGKTGIVSIGYGGHEIYIPGVTVNSKEYAPTNADKLENDTFNIG